MVEFIFIMGHIEGTPIAKITLGNAVQYLDIAGARIIVEAIKPMPQRQIDACIASLGFALQNKKSRQVSRFAGLMAKVPDFPELYDDPQFSRTAVAATIGVIDNFV